MSYQCCYIFFERFSFVHAVANALSRLQNISAEAHVKAKEASLTCCTSAEITILTSSKNVFLFVFNSIKTLTIEPTSNFNTAMQKLGSSLIESGKRSLENASDENHFSFEIQASEVEPNAMIRRSNDLFCVYEFITLMSGSNRTGCTADPPDVALLM